MTGGSATSWREKLFKVLVAGGLSVGKTSVILRYVNKRFVEKYKASIGVDFALKTLEMDPQTVVRLQFWDVAGQERFRKMSRVYYKGAMGVLVVFDVTNSSTLEAASEWKQDLDGKVRLHSRCPVPSVLLANKCDFKGTDRGDASRLNTFCEENGFAGWFETSAKGNVNIDEAVDLLARQMMLPGAGLADEEHQKDSMAVSQASDDSGSRAACCWGPGLRAKGQDF